LQTQVVEVERPPQLPRNDTMIEIDKSKLKDSLLNLKKEEVEEYPYDYIVIDIKKSEAFGGEFEYEHSYNKLGDEVDEWIVEIEDNDTEYIFDRSLIDYEDFEAFTSNIEKLIYYRSRADKAYGNLLSYAQDIVEQYEYNHRHYAQIAWNIRDGKTHKRIYRNEYDFEEQGIENKPYEGMFSLDVEDFIEEKYCFDNEGFEHLDGYYLNSKKIRSFVYEAIATYNNYEKSDLYYPEEFLNN